MVIDYPTQTKMLQSKLWRTNQQIASIKDSTAHLSSPIFSAMFCLAAADVSLAAADLSFATAIRSLAMTFLSNRANFLLK